MSRTPRVRSLPNLLDDMERRLYTLERRLATATAASVQVGSMVFWPTGKAPDPGWLICDGRNFDAAIYPSLQEFLGASVTPNMTDRVPLGAGNKSPGSTGGSAKIGTGQLPAHSHAMGHNHGTVTKEDETHTHGISTRSIKTTSTGGTAWRIADVGGVTGADGTYEQARTGTQSEGHDHYVGEASRSSTADQGSGNDYWQPYRAGYWIIYAGAASGTQQLDLQRNPPEPEYPPRTLVENSQVEIPEYRSPEEG